MNTKGTQATEDKPEEIEKIKRANELEKQALIDQQAKKIEQVRQQVMAEAETAHDMKKQENHREAMERLHTTEAEARRRIQQIQQTAKQTAQQEVQQEAHQHVGSVVNYAEEQHLIKMRAQKEQAQKEAK